jgi:hypothetical protein
MREVIQSSIALQAASYNATASSCPAIGERTSRRTSWNSHSPAAST